MLLVAVFLKALTFALLAFVLDRRGHTLISAIVTAGAGRLSRLALQFGPPIDLTPNVAIASKANPGSFGPGSE